MARLMRRPRAPEAFDPLRAVFRLFTSVRFAIVMVLLAGLAAMLGVIFPQAPDPVRASPEAFAAWMQVQRDRYGPFAEPMRALGLFSVFHSPWFNGLFFVLLAAVAVCTANRLAPTWRAVRRPVRRVNDRFFDHAHARAALAMPDGAAAVVRTLRSHRYTVEQVDERDGVVYLFADRYPWAQLATFVTHLSLILFLAGGIVSKLVGFETSLQVAEGATAPVFPTTRADQMQVLNLDAVEGRDAAGNVIDYHTDLVIYRNGRELCRGTTTVNNPLACAGYRFHQAAYSGDGVGLRVRDLRTGAVVYDEAPLLARDPAMPGPRLTVRDAAGRTLFDDFLVLAPFDERRSLAWVPLEPINKLILATAYRGDAGTWRLSIVHLRDKSDPADKDFQLTLAEGASETVGDLTFAFTDLRGLPALVLQDIPGVTPVALLQLATERDGTPVLHLQNLARRDDATAWLALRPNEPALAGDYEYTFVGMREHTGLLVKRDPGSWIIWVATALLIGGLAVTFYVPRRRLWAKVTPERVYLAGIAERTAHLSDELRRLLEEARRGAGARQDTAAPAPAPDGPPPAAHDPSPEGTVPARRG
jgi:cytochrome c biogenesis protein ResB